jgi:regulator of replication initiation timing
MGTFLKIVLVLILVLSFMGCAGLKKEAREPSSSQKMLADMQQDLAQCRAENEALAKQTAVVKKEEQSGIKRLQQENLALALQVKELQDQLDKGKKETAEAGAKKATAQSASDLKSSKSKTRIKVLWGNGKPASAKKLAARLTSLGYKVEKTGTATRQNYRNNMVYYSKDAKYTAQKLARQLKAEVKPLTWKSEFNILVVAGGK